jgi:hypothetical protein
LAGANEDSGPASPESVARLTGARTYICEPAKEAADRGRGMGHVRVDCRECEAEGRVTMFYEPPHDLAQRHVRLDT